MILGGSLGGLIWFAHRLLRANSDLRAQVGPLTNMAKGAASTWKTQKRDASGRFA